ATVLPGQPGTHPIPRLFQHGHLDLGDETGISSDGRQALVLPPRGRLGGGALSGREEAVEVRFSLADAPGEGRTGTPNPRPRSRRSSLVMTTSQSPKTDERLALRRGDTVFQMERASGSALAEALCSSTPCSRSACSARSPKQAEERRADRRCCGESRGKLGCHLE